jgi:hypothetical protein
MCREEEGKGGGKGGGGAVVLCFEVVWALDERKIKEGGRL